MSRVSERHSLVAAVVLCSAIAAALERTSCLEDTKTNTGGTLTSLNYNDFSNENGSCSYVIQSRNGYMEMQLMDVVHRETDCKGDDCCVSLEVGTKNGALLFCANVNFTKTSWRFVGDEFKVSYKVPMKSRSAIKLNYTTSRVCSAMEFECDDRFGCYDMSSICDKRADCRDKSDEVHCARRVCKNGMRKSRYFVCESGDCIDLYMVNNGIKDCADGSDEKLGTSYIMLITVVLFSMFTLLICRWYVFRRDVIRLMDDMPEFPLPPFRAPGDILESEEPEVSETDLQSGGDIFEAYLDSRRNSEMCQRHRVKRVKSKDMKRLIDPNHGDDSFIALASLGIDLNSCIGLSKENIHRINSATSTSASKKDSVTILVEGKPETP